MGAIIGTVLFVNSTNNYNPILLSLALHLMLLLVFPPLSFLPSLPLSSRHTKNIKESRDVSSLRNLENFIVEKDMQQRQQVVSKYM